MIIKNEVGRQLTYRTSIISFVIGNMFELFAQLIIWTAIFKTLETVKGYTYHEMMTYVIVGWIFMFITTNYNLESVIAEDIHKGTLSNFVTKPLSYIRYIIAKASGRVTIALIVVCFQVLLVILLFHSYLVFNVTFSGLLILLLMLIMSYLIQLFLSIIIGLVAFWTIEIGGVYAIINTIANFLSGVYFPINLLPTVFLNFSLLLPFVYTFYIPVQFFLGKISQAEALRGVLVQIVWLFILYLIIKLIWKYGYKKYESVGM